MYKISDLIADLTKLKKQHGDLPLFYRYYEEDSMFYSLYGFNKDMCKYVDVDAPDKNFYGDEDKRQLSFTKQYRKAIVIGD